MPRIITAVYDRQALEAIVGQATKRELVAAAQ